MKGPTMLPKDPVILLSYINLKLRDFYPSLDELCAAEQISREELEKTFASIDYAYDAEANAFV